MSPSGQRVVHSWKPAEVLGLANSEKHSASKWSCPAQTLKKTRCLKARDASSYVGANLILNEMAITDPATFLDDKDKLVKLAELTLCSAYHLHGYKTIPGWAKQISCVDLAVAEWVALISAYIAKKNNDSNETANSANSPGLNSGPYEEQGHRNSKLVAAVETPLATDPLDTSEPGVHTDVPIKLERSEARGPSARVQALHQPSSVAPTIRASPVASDQLDLEAFKDLTLENDRLKTENSKLRNQFENIKKRVARIERERKAVEKERDELSSQVDELYEEINDLGDRLERLEMSR